MKRNRDLKNKKRSGRQNGRNRLLAAALSAALVCGSFGFGGLSTAYADTPDGDAAALAADEFATAETALTQTAEPAGADPAEMPQESPDAAVALSVEDVLSAEEGNPAEDVLSAEEGVPAAGEISAAEETPAADVFPAEGAISAEESLTQADAVPAETSLIAEESPDPADAVSAETARIAEEGPVGEDAPLAEETDEEISGEVTEDLGRFEETFVPDGGALPDSDDLFAEYVDRIFYGDYSISTIANYGERFLDERGLAIYSQLKEMITEVASGNRTSTAFDLDTTALTWTAEELGTTSTDDVRTAVNARFSETIHNVFECLLVDCPYELYWFDKTAGMLSEYNIKYTSSSDGTLKAGSVSDLTVTFRVASAYQGSGNTTVDTGKTSAAQTAASNAQSIVAKYASCSDDREKAESYKDAICALVSYDDSAANNSGTPYGDSWQLIYVFDGDSSTNVVCEGYAKAFQYLCDMGLDDSTSYIVSGTLTGANGTGGHMWNVLNLEGCNFLVDVTNSDTGTAGANGGLFLVDDTAATYVNEGVEYRFTVNGTTLAYIYDDTTLSLYDESVRVLGATKPLYITAQPSDLTLTYGYSGAALSVKAYANSGTLSYQWYTKNSDGSGTKVSGATGSSYTVPTGMSAGTTTYYCVVSLSDGGENYTLQSNDAVVTVGKKTLTPSISGTASKTYDGTTSVSGLSISLSGIVSGDTVKASATYAYDSADAGTGIGIRVTGITLKGSSASNYTLSKTTLTTTGTIKAKTLKDSMVSGLKSSYEYTGKAITPSVTVSDTVNGKQLITSKDYSVTYADNTSAGTASVTVSGKRNYSGTVKKTFTIKKSSTSEETDIVKINGVWTYTVNGTADYTYTGLAKNANGWYYIKNGKLDRSYTGFSANSNGKWYVESGKVTKKTNGVFKDKTGAIGSKNEWYYVVGSKVQTGFTGLANYKNASGWWYITKGRVDRSYNGLAKNINGWFYLTNGKVDRSYTGFSANSNGKWYVESGKVTKTTNGVFKDTKGVIGSKNEWYYVVGSKVQTNFTGLANYKNDSGWWYITKGKVDRSYNGLAKNKNGWYYLANGKVDRSYTGFASNASGTWYVKNGRVQMN